MRRRRVVDRLFEGRSDAEFTGQYEQLGREIARRRAQLQVSQRALAELCGTTQSAIARLEGGSRAPRLDTLIRVANALDCELGVRLRPRTKGDSK